MRADRAAAPPRLAWALIRRRLPGGLGEVIGGDLEEEYRSRVLPSMGRARADLWFWGQALALRSRALRRLSHRLVSIRPTWDGEGAMRPRRSGPREEMEMLSQDVRHAFRGLARSPGFTLVAVLSLAAGVGVNTTIFSAVDAAFSRPLPIPKLDEVVRFETPRFAYEEYRELQDNLTGLSSLVAVRRGGAVLRAGERTETLLGASVSPNYFTALGVRPALGRLFEPADLTESGSGVVVLGHDLWTRRFGGAPGIVGRTLTLNERPVVVLGVAERGFDGERRIPRSAWWMPEDPAREGKPQAVRDFELLGRLAPGRTAPGVQAEARALAARFGWTLPVSPNTDGITVWTQARSDKDHGGILVYLIMPMVGLVLLVACANVSGLLLARHEERRREMAVCLAMGAEPSRLIRKYLAEGMLLAAAGTVGGLLLTAWSGRFVEFLVPTGLAGVAPQPRVDDRVLGLAVGLSVVATLASSLLPAWRAVRVQVGPALKGDPGPGSRGSRALNPRNVLVVGQLATATRLLAVTFLFARSFLRGTDIDLGFSERNMLLVTVAPEMNRLDRRQVLDYLQRLQAQVSGLPGVRSVSLTAHPPLGLSGGGMTIPVSRPGLDAPTAEGQPVRYTVVEPRYFETAGVRLVAGRDFTARDDETSARVAIVSETAARQWWPSQEPLGRTFRVGSSPQEEVEVVGVARDVAVVTLNEAPAPYVYLPFRQAPRGGMTLLVAGIGDPAALAPEVRRTMRESNPDVPPLTVETMPSLVRFALLPQWIGAWAGVLLGAITVVLGVGGLFALVAHAVSKRTRELGIRMALGADGRATMWIVLRQGLLLGAAGVALGLPLAIVLSSVLRSLLLGVGPADPLALGGASLAVLSVAGLASLVPAWRATHVDPMTALRTE
ncbi:MAG: ABC transporter permease [Gemmatimonadetes bacterium]|nr:ABC transporter permease [Gemmatimonadota bacterium]